MVTLTLAQSKIRVSTAVLAFRVKRVPHVIVQGLTSLETIANLVSQLVASLRHCPFYNKESVVSCLFFFLRPHSHFKLHSRLHIACVKRHFKSALVRRIF